MSKSIKQKRRKGQSVQELIGIRTFTQYGLLTSKGELLFYTVAPTNISVLSHASIETKIRNLTTVLSAVPDVEITCTDSSECFDANKAYLKNRIEREKNPKLREILKKDVEFLDQIQVEMATARQFLLTVRFKGKTPAQVFHEANHMENDIFRQGFEVRRMRKADIKRFLAIYFEAGMSGEQMPDADGEQYFEGMDAYEED